jgi:outer membrane immunogenic protein
MFKRVFVAVVALVAMVALLVAPERASAQTGLYAGINGTYAIEGTLRAWQDGSGREAIKPTGGIFGLQVGYNYMLTDQLMIGAEADYQIVSASGRESFLACPASLCGVNVTQTNTIDMKNVGTVRVRIGYKVGRYLPYLSAGYTYGNAVARASFGGVMPNIKQRVDPSGLVVGAGLDYWLNTNWSVRTEYGHLKLADGNARFSAHLVRFGINYLF